MSKKPAPFLEKLKNARLEKVKAEAAAASPVGGLKSLLTKVKSAQAESPPATVEPPALPVPAPVTPAAIGCAQYTIARLPGEAGIGMGLSANGCEVTTVNEGQPAHRAGIPVGAKIVEVGGVPVSTTKEFGGEVRKFAGRDIVVTLAMGSNGAPVLPQHQRPAGNLSAAPQMAPPLPPPPPPPPPFPPPPPPPYFSPPLPLSYCILHLRSPH
eukprot:TRINITY_DN584_c1_g2_i6.p2 TRINITY_DN584_c1_g2~~TRINITY_DN584_c1_g2_i6.p2  ORF type:complete len:241 (+),score=60.93 TRINITY_DN584_c1_g2_i6:89-724(+)